MADAKPAQKSALLRPIPLTLMIGACVYAYFWSTGSPTTTTHHLRKSSSLGSGADADGMTPADYAAHFKPYEPSKRDPFASALNLSNTLAGEKGEWDLTGINSSDGVTTAVVENKTTGDNAFLRTGDTWNGLHVLSITADSVTLENEIGQDTKLSFPPDNLDNGPGPEDETGTVTVPTAPPLPNLDQTTGTPATPSAFRLQPLPVPAPPISKPATKVGEQRGSSSQASHVSLKPVTTSTASASIGKHTAAPLKAAKNVSLSTSAVQKATANPALSTAVQPRQTAEAPTARPQPQAEETAKRQPVAPALTATSDEPSDHPAVAAVIKEVQVNEQP